MFFLIGLFIELNEDLCFFYLVDLLILMRIYVFFYLVDYDLLN